MAGAIMFGTQAVDLRTYLVKGHSDARAPLSPASLKLYETVREFAGQPPSESRPYIRNDNEQVLAEHIRLIANDIAADGRISQSIERIVTSLNC